jgi:hypothetical protein
LYVSSFEFPLSPSPKSFHFDKRKKKTELNFVDEENSAPPTAHFGPTSPATLRVDADAESVVLAALSSVTSTWTNGPSYLGLKSAVFGLSFFPFPSPLPLPSPYDMFSDEKEKAAPTPIQLSLAISGYDWDAIVRSSWYTSVPAPWQEVVTAQEERLQSVYNNITGEHALVSVGSGGRRMGGGNWMVVGVGLGVQAVVVGLGVGVVGLL